ncbi:MAG: YbaN family protein [Pseudomonadota bacterium]
MKPSRRHIYRTLGGFFLAVGTLGIGIPLLPTVPFWILAAFFFARSEPALRDRIYAHPRFGPPVQSFLEQGALSRRAKAFAVGGITSGVSLGVFVFPLPGYASLALVAVLIPVVIYLLTRPPPSE